MTLLVAEHRHRVDQEVELHALLFGALDLLGRGRHVVPLAAVDDVHLARAQAPGRAGGVHGRVAAADHHHALALQVGRLPDGDVAQHLHGVVDARLVFAVDAQVAAAVRAERQHDGRVAVVLAGS